MRASQTQACWLGAGNSEENRQVDQVADCSIAYLVVVQHLEQLWTISLGIEVASGCAHPFLVEVPYPEGHCFQEILQRMEAVHKAELVVTMSVLEVVK